MKWFVEISVEELDWPAQSPDLNPIAYSEPGLNRPTSVSALTNALVAEWKSHSNVPTSSGKPSQKSGGCYSSKGGDQLHVNAHDFRMRRSMSKCPHTFGHVVCVYVCIRLSVELATVHV